jgi:hypothetical protein
MKHVSAEMTLRYASLASPTVRAAYAQAMSKARSRLTLPIAPVGQANVPDRVQWLRAEMLKTRVAHGYCSRNLVAEACPYANICEQCDNFTTSVEFVPALQSQLTEVIALHDDARARGWDTEVARHARVISSLTRHLDRLARQDPPHTPTWHRPEGRLIERWFKELTDKRLRRGRFTSVADLTDAITTWAAHWNNDPKPFIWKATADDIITKVQRGRDTLHQIKSTTDH